MIQTGCSHYKEQVKGEVQSQSTVCQDCALTNEKGHLRMCLTCGYVGCCESEQSHDTQHWKQTGHAIIQKLPLEGDRSFIYCYEDAEYLKR